MHNDHDMKAHDDQPATKGDLAQFATKADLDRFAAKFDLDRFAAKLNLDRFATKDDLDRKIDGVRRDLAIEIIRTQADVREIKEVMATKNDIERVMNSIDSLTGKYVNHDHAVISHGQVLTEVQVKMKEHDQRIKSLEMRTPS